MRKHDEFVEEMKARLDEWHADIDKLTANTLQASDEARGKYQISTKRIFSDPKSDRRKRSKGSKSCSMPVKRPGRVSAKVWRLLAANAKNLPGCL